MPIVNKQHIFDISKQKDIMKPLKTLATSFAALINNSATNQQKLIVWATIAVPMMIVIIVFGSNLK